MESSYKHSYEMVKLKGVRYKVRIDKEIVDLVKALNYIHMETEMSCQNNIDDRVWVSFKFPYGAASFMELIAERSPNLRKKVINATTEKYDKENNRIKCKDRWWVDSYVNVNGQFAKQFGIRISIRFPRKHLREVEKIVVKEAKRRKKLNEHKTKT